MIRDMGKKETGEQGKSNNQEEMFCLWGVGHITCNCRNMENRGEERSIPRRVE